MLALSGERYNCENSKMADNEEIETVTSDCGRFTLTQAMEMMDQFENDANIVDAELEVCDYEMDDAVVKELDAFEQSNGSKFAHSQTERYTNRFKQFLQERKFCCQIEKLVPKTLNSFLRQFYYSLRGKNGEWLAPSTLGCIRAKFSCAHECEVISIFSFAVILFRSCVLYYNIPLCSFSVYLTN